MSAKDVIKKSIIDSFTAETSIAEVAVVLIVTLLIGLFIFAVYRICTRQSFYSKDFNKSLVLMAVITAAIVLAMQSNLVISLGMVGALSIVRFRNAVKDPMDLVFLFWAISVGIICGAGLYLMAVVLSGVITMALLLLDFVPEQTGAVLLVVNTDDVDSLSEVGEIVRKYTKKYKMKSRNVTKHGVDAILEVKCKDEINLISEISKMEKVSSVSLVDYSGEIRI